MWEIAGAAFYVIIAESLILELCELVGDRLSRQLEQQLQQFKPLEQLRPD